MKRPAPGRRPRSGLATILAVATLAILAIIMGAVFAQGLRGRHMADRRGEQLQTLWLARSGLEMAAAHLVDDPLYTGETMRPIPGSLVTVKIERRGEDYIVASEARHAVESSAPLVHRVARH